MNHYQGPQDQTRLMTAPIDGLAPELLNQILSWVYKTDARGRNNLAICLLVCRQWNQQGQSILYRDLVLDTGNLQQFLESFDKNALSSYTRALTLRASAPLVEDWDPNETDAQKYHSISFNRLDGWLRRLTYDVFPLMNKLITLSICVMRNQNCKLSKHTLAAVLKALPATCVDLELDTNGKDSDDINNDFDENTVSDDSTHLCEELRRILPRLQHVRLNLRFTCGALVGKYEEDGFNPIKIPNVQQFLINCRRVWSTSQCCPQTISENPSVREQRSWHSLIHGLSHVMDCGGLRPGADVRVLAQSAGSLAHATIKKTLLCYHATEKCTWAYPLATTPLKGEVLYFLRTESGGFIGESRYLQDIIEGFSWITLKTEARLHKDRVRDGVAESIDVTPEEEWRTRWPRQSCALWVNESKTGMLLAEAERRDGPLGSENGYDALQWVVELTPEGWYRPEQTDGALLERVQGLD
ncbi:hypothetical protein B0I35DRAFT_425457 [Stachybotrys elegans]|uniref:F-box domain-containing protein n=1 Tax=Stachybotrys elegans TaxID=80388 RepID=A0A8K0T2Q9_9HYPO|nr:hypothetical protein B0I35DRAFT_425457 [Stachybotrys elegans]